MTTYSIRTNCDVNDANHLWGNLKILLKWERTLLVQYSLDKSEKLCVTNRWDPVVSHHILDGTIFANVKSIKYLGLNTENNLSWIHHTGTFSRKS